MKAVITGANSFIGTRLAERFAAAGWESVLVVRPGRETAAPQNARFLPLCMEEYARLGDLAGECDCLIHLAWKGTRGPLRIDSRVQNENVEYSLQAVRSMIRVGCKRIITAGSQAEYGLHHEQITEESECAPNTAYGKAKLLCYQRTAELCKQMGIEHKEGRIFSVYGPGDYAGTMIAGILDDMRAGRPCKLTQGIQLWDFLYIEDVAEGLFRLGSMPCADGVYNLGSGDVRPLREYVMEMAQITKTDSPLLFGAIPYPDAGMVSLWPDVSKIKRELHWEPKTCFAEGIRSVLESMD